ncbi:MAG: hypothetical protein IJZ04_04890 [Clostridia bacterium]|nr:hypothetical protein [Clostridia bacterium]
MRNAECGIRNDKLEYCFVVCGTNSYCARAELTTRGTRAECGVRNGADANSEFGVRNSEFGIRSSECGNSLY